MSTTHRVFTAQDGAELDITERSCRFDVSMYSESVPDRDNANWIEIEQLSPEQVVDIALKLIQPTLYSVDNPKEFYENVILEGVRKLFV